MSNQVKPQSPFKQAEDLKRLERRAALAGRVVHRGQGTIVNTYPRPTKAFRRANPGAWAAFKANRATHLINEPPPSTDAPKDPETEATPSPAIDPT